MSTPEPASPTLGHKVQAVGALLVALGMLCFGIVVLILIAVMAGLIN